MPLPTALAVDTSPIQGNPAITDLDPVWRAIVTESRTRSNDIHLPISVAYAERLCDAYPEADALLSLIHI